VAGKRTYGDPCGIARALDVIGERWAVLVVRELLLGPKRFTDLRAGLPHLGPDVLSQRLRELEQAGVVRRDRLPPPAASRVYGLTDWGRQLEPVVLALGRWGSQAPFPPDHAALGVDALVLALKTLFDPGRGRDLAGNRYELVLGPEQRFALRIGEQGLEAARGSAPDAVATITTDPGTLQQVLWHRWPLREARRSSELEIAGDQPAAERFLELFPLPGAG
jgi:DNA-binding HxlR family transcriptional regulator